MANKKYTQEFKDSTVQLILNNDEKATTIASDLDLNLKKLYAWIYTYKNYSIRFWNIKKQIIFKQELEIIFKNQQEKRV